MKKIIITSIVALAFVALNATSASAAVSAGTGTLYPTTAPGETMYSIEEIYNLLTASTTATLGSGEFLEAPEKTNGTITLEDLYEAALSLRSSIGNEDEDDDTDTDTGTGTSTETVIPDNSEVFKQIQTMKVLDTYTSGRYALTINATASNVAMYIPKTLNLDYITLNGSPVSTVIPTITTSVTSSLPTQGDYYKLNPGQSADFSLRFNLENLGGSTNIENGKIVFTRIEYKNGSTGSSMKTFIPAENEYVISEIYLKNN